MHQISRRWNRISLRTKITGVTVLMLTLGLLVSGIGTAAMLRSYVEEQLASKLNTIANGGLMRYFEGTASPPAASNLDRLWSEDVFVAVYDSKSHQLDWYNWGGDHNGAVPVVPEYLSQAEVNAQNASSSLGTYRTHQLNDQTGQPSFRAIRALVASEQLGSYSPIIVAISSKDTEHLLGAYLTIFLGFGLGVVLVGALLTRMLVTSTFLPLRQVERTAAAIADGDFSQRVGGATPNTEVGRLSRSLNTMLNRIDRAFRDRAHTIEQMRRFVGDASHELRTPLVSVRGYAELYRMGALQTPEEVAQAMDRIESEAIRMGGLVEDLLALARIDEQKPLELSEVDLVPLARDAALDAVAANPTRRITVIAPEVGNTDAASPHSSHVRVELGADRTTAGALSLAGATLARLRGRRARGDTPATPAPGHLNGSGVTAASARRAMVMAEENKIRQVITNLLANAVRFTSDACPIEICVSIDENAERAMMEVIDHGEGIPLQIREKIFQRFWRADTSRTRETGGSGLGLAIVSSIVAAHDGTVDVVETPGGGATFRVSLPLVRSSGVASIASP